MTGAQTAPCTVAGCPGSIVDGYCDTCGMAPRAQATSPTFPMGRAAAIPRLRPSRHPGSHRRPDGTVSTSASGRTGSRSTGSRRSSSMRTGIGLGLVEVPSVPTVDPATAVMAVAEVPEDKRFCSSCGEPVGRARGGRPGRTDGFCPHCGGHFAFTPRLEPGEIVGGQYEVLGALAHGGLGWIHLARDRAVSDRWVVLKGLLDTSSEDAALAAVAERRFLASLDHPALVKIYNFVTHDDAGYIVMEYVGGQSLKAVQKERQVANGGRIDPLPVDRAVAYMLGVLPAMAYMHGEGLVYCDMKPDNVMLTGDGLKIIDLGGVRRIDDEDAAIYGTVGFQAPEVAEVGPSVASDLFTIGRTLAALVLDFRGYQTGYAHTLPPPDEQPLLAGHESLHRFLLKATAYDPDDRFVSADEMAEQLVGVLREEVAARGEVRPAVSALFGPDVAVGRADLAAEATPGWRALPVPKVDPSDPAAGTVLGLGDLPPAAVIATLTSGATPVDSPEVVVRTARAHLALGQPDEASTELDRLGDLRDWRVWWHRGLVALATGRADDAVDWLDPVCTDLPGEVAPRFALAVAAEAGGDLDRAEGLYARVLTVDPGFVSAAFALARVRLARGDRAGAVAGYERVPVASSARPAADLASVRALTGDAGTPATVDDLVRAGQIVERLDLDPVRRAALERDLYRAGLAVVDGVAPLSGNGVAPVLGRRLTETDLRRGLEHACRVLAKAAPTRDERVRLVDEANQSRPRTLV